YGLPPGNVRLLIIDPEPLLIARIDAQLTIDQTAATTSTEFAHWDNRATANEWNLILADHTYRFILPPQALGEDMHRRHVDDDVQPGRPVRFRLGGTTVMDLEASYWDQRYSPAVWNTRRNLAIGGAAQRDPGPTLASLQFELLYGIRGEIINP